MIFLDYLKVNLESKYLGKRIKSNVDESQSFIVENIDIRSSDDPPLEIVFSSKKYKLLQEKYELWQAEAYKNWKEHNLPYESYPPTPLELEKELNAAGKESYYIASMEDELPEIVN